MKLFLFLLLIFSALYSDAQTPISATQAKSRGCKLDTLNPLPKTWLWIQTDGSSKTLTPYVDSSGPNHNIRIVCFNGDVSTGFQPRYLGADVVKTDSIRTHGNKGEHMRMHPFQRGLYASEWPNMCAAKAAFWRMVNEHSNHHE